MTIYSNSANKAAVNSMIQKATLPIKGWKGLAALQAPDHPDGFPQDGVSWKSNPTPVMEYFRALKNRDRRYAQARSQGTRDELVLVLRRWLLIVTNAKVRPDMTTGTDNIAISRFVDKYIPNKNTNPFKPGVYEPKSGDMYCMLPVSPLAKDPHTPTHHIGFVIGRQIPGDLTSKILTLDGNSANEMTLMPYWHKGKGGGMVCINAHDEKKLIAYYIPQPDLGTVTAMPMPRGVWARRKPDWHRYGVPVHLPGILAGQKTLIELISRGCKVIGLEERVGRGPAASVGEGQWLDRCRIGAPVLSLGEPGERRGTPVGSVGASVAPRRRQAANVPLGAVVVRQHRQVIQEGEHLVAIPVQPLPDSHAVGMPRPSREHQVVEPIDQPPVGLVEGRVAEFLVVPAQLDSISKQTDRRLNERPHRLPLEFLAQPGQLAEQVDQTTLLGAAQAVVRRVEIADQRAGE